jgi:type I restriction enzyme R subunit
MITEADTCRQYVLPKLREAGWEDLPHSIAEQKTFTDGRIIVVSDVPRRAKPKRADYLLRFTRDFTIGVVEAKAAYMLPGDGLQQAKEYAEMLSLKFAYSTNGHGIVEFDFSTGKEAEIDRFPTPVELWSRLQVAEGFDERIAERFLEPLNRETTKESRYYQSIAIERAVAAILGGERRVLLTMATGTGKTFVAFQVCWKLWSSRWNRTGEYRKPRILYLADRNMLVDDPKEKMFAPFGEARHKIQGEAQKGREMYFAIYQAIARDEHRPGLYREYAPDYFDLIIIDEAHRGSARDESNWREILEYFGPAFQLGMTATPRREENLDTYAYFGNPVYQYSLKQGIEDGFLAPYRVHRVVSNIDATGWRPAKGQTDRYGQLIRDGEYGTKEFETRLVIDERTKAIAAHLTNWMRSHDRFGKTIVFCADQEHADRMRRALNNTNADLVKDHADYVCRVTSDEGAIGIGHLSRFQDVETKTPVILTTSQLLTTGIDAPTCRNIVIARVVQSMTEFKQMIGRGTRLQPDYEKYFFDILDYTGSATRLFADPEFDGWPVLITEEEINAEGETLDSHDLPLPEEQLAEEVPTGIDSIKDDSEGERRKYYVDGVQVEIAAEAVHELGPDGRLLVRTYREYVGEKVRTLCRSAIELRGEWQDPTSRGEIIDRLAERGIDFDHLARATGQPEADPFDLLLHVAFNAPLRTRRERAERVRTDDHDFFQRYGPDARCVLDELLAKYTDHGVAEFRIPDVLKLPPISDRGNVGEIAALFGGAEQLRAAIVRLQNLLYAA